MIEEYTQRFQQYLAPELLEGGICGVFPGDIKAEDITSGTRCATYLPD
jgi:hypothetical protein